MRINIFLSYCTTFSYVVTPTRNLTSYTRSARRKSGRSLSYTSFLGGGQILKKDVMCRQDILRPYSVKFAKNPFSLYRLVT